MRRPKLTEPTGLLCYDCQGCGVCCRGYFQVEVTAEERARLVAQGWGDRPEYQGEELFRQEGERWVLRHRPDGTCLFLDGHGRCRIHAEFGEAAKPLACRLYPFVFVPAGDEVRVDVRFDCPSAAASRGRALSAHFGALQQLLPQVAERGEVTTVAPPFSDGREVGWPALKRVTASFDRLVADISLSLTDRLLACVDLAALLADAPLEALRGQELGDYLTAAVRRVVERRLEEPFRRRPPRLSTMALFRQLAGMYGRADRLGQAAQAASRLLTSLRVLVGVGTVPAIRADFPQASFAAIERVSGPLPPEAATVLARYYRTRFASLGFFGPGYYGRSYLDGLNALLLTYPLLLWYARFFAAGGGRDRPGAADAIRALTVVDHQHGRAPLLDHPSERRRRAVLTEPDTLRTLMAWYGNAASDQQESA